MSEHASEHPRYARASNLLSVTPFEPQNIVLCLNLDMPSRSTVYAATSLSRQSGDPLLDYAPGDELAHALLQLVLPELYQLDPEAEDVSEGWARYEYESVLRGEPRILR